MESTVYNADMCQSRLRFLAMIMFIYLFPTCFKSRVLQMPELRLHLRKTDTCKIELIT